MQEEELERLALLAIIAGLLLVLVIMPKYEYKDAHHLTENDNKAYLEGTINTKRYSEETGWSIIEITTTKTTTSFYKGEINKKEGDTIHIKGSYHEGTFTIKEYK